MPVYLGQLGRMVELPYVTATSVSQGETYSFQTTLEGRVKAQARPSRARRAWSVSADRYMASAQGLLAQFVQGAWGAGPFVWVSSDAQVLNMLSPEMANCQIIQTAGVTSGGPVRVSDGGWSPSSILTNGAAAVYFGPDRSPVLPLKPVTASAEVMGAGSRVAVSFFNATGGFISSVTSPAGGVAGLMKRIAVSADAPATSASAQIFVRDAFQAARPAITWTKTMFDWADGQGCAKAVLHGASKEIQSAHYDPRGLRVANVSFTVTEVG